MSLTLMLAVVTAPAHAAATVDAGWWTAAPVPIAPDAPDDGLVVQGGPDPSQPFAYAAVAYALSGGDVPLSLKLSIAPGSASTAGAVLTVCPLTEAFDPAQGGAMNDAPAFDCTTNSTASPAADGTSYEFDVMSLYAPGTLALAVLPAAATDRVVLARPTPEALETVLAQPSATEPAPAPPGAGLSEFVDVDDAGPVDSLAPGISGSSDLSVTPAPAAPSSLPVDTPSAAASTRSVASAAEESLVPAAIFGLLLVVAVALWVFAGMPKETSPA